MNNLIRTDLHSLKKNRLYLTAFPVIFILVLISSLFGVLAGDIRSVENDPSLLSDVFFSRLLGGDAALLISAVFLPFFAAEDFDTGIIRNKILAGFGRSKIYFSKLIATFIFGMSLYAFSVVLNLVVLSVVFGKDIFLISEIASGGVLFIKMIFAFFSFSVYSVIFGFSIESRYVGLSLNVLLYITLLFMSTPVYIISVVALLIGLYMFNKRNLK